MIKQKQPYKIALIGDSLAGGGAEKVHALLSGYFADHGFEVHNCILMDWISYDYSGSLLNLGKIKVGSGKITRKAARFAALSKFINHNNFDFVIDFRMRTNLTLEFLLSKFIFPKGTFYTVHHHLLGYYFP